MIELRVIACHACREVVPKDLLAKVQAYADKLVKEYEESKYVRLETIECGKNFQFPGSNDIMHIVDKEQAVYYVGPDGLANKASGCILVRKVE